MKNRMVVMQQMIKEKQYDKVLEYTGEIADKLSQTLTYSNTGNVALDSIINYKLTRATKSNILVESNVVIPEDISLDEDYMKKSQKKKQISEMLQYIGLSNMEKYPVYKLSGDEQQRVAMAIIILQGSDLILADEPTGSLNGDNRDMVISLLAEMKKQGKAVLIVTHDPYIAEKCDRTIQL